MRRDDAGGGTVFPPAVTVSRGGAPFIGLYRRASSLKCKSLAALLWRAFFFQKNKNNKYILGVERLLSKRDLPSSQLNQVSARI